jgi:NAD(P)-dependent dehydrogenase (short-subunit alcohol dehydrogenase family)
MPVAIVTGASRGLGRGIARALGAHGFTVYVTGRPEGSSSAPPGGLQRTAAAVDAAGGHGVAVTRDHRDVEQNEALVGRVREAEGRLDVLVNNAAAVHPELAADQPFWKQPVHLAEMLDSGLRTSYLVSRAAAPLLIERRGGLIVSISFYGSVSYFHGPAYGAAKAGTDKLAYDMAVELAPHGVASVALWPGFIQTEIASELGHTGLERPDVSGHLVAALWRDPALMELTGRTLTGGELGQRYGIVDDDGRPPRDHRQRLGAPRAFPPIPEHAAC